MPDSEDTAVSNPSLMPVWPLAPLHPQLSRSVPAFLYLPPTSWSEGTENLPVDFSSNLSLAFQQLSSYFPAFIISCSLHLSEKPAQRPFSLSLPIPA